MKAELIIRFRNIAEGGTGLVFVDVDRLIDDFIQEVERWKSGR